MNFKVKHFSELSEKELLEIVKSRTEVFVIEQKIIEEDIDEVDRNSYHMFLEDSGIAAYCRILKAGQVYNEASIGRVLVTKENRNKGLAKTMMEEAIKFIFNKLNEDKIKISAQEYIVPLYKSLGFVTKGEVYDEVGIPHIKMICNRDYYKKEQFAK